MRFPIHVTKRRAALNARRAPCRIDENRPHPGQVDNNAVIAQGSPGNVVAATSDRHEKVVGAREHDRVHDIRRSSAADDQTRTLVDAGVPDAPRTIILRIFRTNDLPRNTAR